MFTSAYSRLSLLAVLHDAYSDYITCPTSFCSPFFALMLDQMKNVMITNWKHQRQRITGVTFHLPHDKSKENWPRKLCQRIFCQREKQECIFGSISDMLIGNLMALMREKKLLPHWEVGGVQPVACNSSYNDSPLFHYTHRCYKTVPWHISTWLAIDKIAVILLCILLIFD